MILHQQVVSGTYVAVNPSLATHILLENWAIENNVQLRDDLHVTLLYSRNPIKVTPEQNVTYIAEAKNFDVFDNKLVLKFARSSLDRRHEQLIRAGGTHDFPEFNPHITLSDTVNMNLPLPNFAFVFEDEFVETLDLDHP